MLGDTQPPDRRTGWIVALGVGALLSPLVLIALLRSAAATDIRWESHTAHFWLVLAAALITLGLGYALSVTARRRRDARLFLIALAFMASFGFLALHALATPDVLLGKNAGFELATPVGLVVAGAARRRLGARAERAAIGGGDAARAGFVVALLCLLALWGAVSLTETWPLDQPLAGEQLDGWQVALAAVGVSALRGAALGYFRLYRRRGRRSSSRSHSPLPCSPRRWS